MGRQGKPRRKYIVKFIQNTFYTHQTTLISYPVTFPVGHLVHSLDENCVAYSPVPHGRHRVDPVALANVPGGHGLHVDMLVAPVEFENVPRSQGVHSAKPRLLANVPPGHGSHLDAPDVLTYVPASHSAQLTPPVGE